MKKRRKCARSARSLIFASVVVSVTGIMAACSSSVGGEKPSQIAQAETPRQAEMLRLIKSDCGACHGLTRRGGMGAPIRPENLVDKSAAVIAEIILDGIPGTPMPPWRPYLSPDEAIWMARALKQGRGLQ